MNHTFIGIDFGTTKTLVSVYSEQKREAKIIRLGRGRDDIPTSVFAAEDSSFLCGDEAEDLCAAEPMRYARAFKMKLGSQEVPLAYPEGEEFKQLTAMELARVFLSHVRKECERLTGKQIKQAVITRPVRFSPQQCKQLEEAARDAGFEEPIFITEPEAAARTYCRHHADDLFTNALIIDWGGGTLDMALVSRTDGQIATYTKYTDGIPRGGENFDDALYHLVQERFSDDEGNVSRLNKDMLELEFNYTIRKNLRSAKEMLSRLQQHTLRLSGSEGAYPAVKVRRSEFEKVIQDDVEKAAKMACDLIKSISDPELKPDRLILVGGSSRIPAVADILKERTGLPCHTWDMSVEAVGLGAALVAAERWENKKSEPIKEPLKPAPKSKTAAAPHLSRSSSEKKAASPKKGGKSKTCNTEKKQHLPKRNNEESDWIDLVIGIGVVVGIIILLVLFWYIIIPVGILIFLYHRFKKS